ncbi:hypothetical protein ERO13_A07G037650v2 [Gossypium hirsutum]|uniref:Uncharacterized protein n=2 Tax=Gossypium TaxID=3633 RepID=A0A5J5UZI9_GOSBA|nr:hypothetical protein ES319_A07G043300v1 [Gossypium barbadense]KAG4190541.1 hypothetical protein ERO13_A07G037650v2 [Gossypium hirsutum]TYH08796.1 hypothetical protein ES288_A07G045400v1 [Gossypium darwinii]
MCRFMLSSGHHNDDSFRFMAAPPRTSPPGRDHNLYPPFDSMISLESSFSSKLKIVKLIIHSISKKQTK